MPLSNAWLAAASMDPCAGRGAGLRDLCHGFLVSLSLNTMYLLTFLSDGS